MQFIFDLVFLIDYVDYFLTYGNIKIIYRLTFTFTLQSRNSKYLYFVIYGICFWLYMQEIYIWLALLLPYTLASIMERFLSAIHINKYIYIYIYICVCVCVCVCVCKQITILLLRAFRNLKLARIFKLLILFYL